MPTVWYISKLGSNLDGKSWATAYNEMDQVNWSLVGPGDTINLDGGATSMVYTTPLIPLANGTSTLPITIKVSSDSGRDGMVELEGGRNMALPYYDQPAWAGNNGPLGQSAIDLRGANGTAGLSWIVLDGAKRSGITAFGWTQTGLVLCNQCANLTIRNLELYDNGTAFQNGGTNKVSNGVTLHANNWYAKGGFGILFAGKNITFQNVLSHDNAEDGAQTHYTNTGFSNITFQRYWGFNTRLRPAGDIWNFYVHPDGIQCSAGLANPTVNSGLHVIDSILGPNTSTGGILSDPGNATKTNDVTFQDVLVYGQGSQAGPELQAGTGVHDGDGPIPTGWVLTNVTIDRGEFNNSSIEFDDTPTYSPANFDLVDSLITGGGNIDVNPGCAASGNYRYNAGGGNGLYLATALSTNPYVTPSSHGSIDPAADFTISPLSTAFLKGSSLVSSTQLLALIDADNGSTGPPPPPPCGGQGQPCCAGSPACTAPLTCQSGFCLPPPPPPCGAQGQPCCSSGPPCQGTLTCQGGLCLPPPPPPPPCGGQGQPCCASGQACIAPLTCQSGVCQSPSQPPCGALGQPCCTLGIKCADGLTCDSTLTCVQMSVTPPAPSVNLVPFAIAGGLLLGALAIADRSA